MHTARSPRPLDPKSIRAAQRRFRSSAELHASRLGSFDARLSSRSARSVGSFMFSASDGSATQVSSTPLFAPSFARAPDPESSDEVRRFLDRLPLLRVDGSSSADFQISGELGSGGMGVVNAARQSGLNREVAIKRVRPDGESKLSRLSALLAEAQIQGALDHPNIAPLYALGRDANGLPVLVMKRLTGVSWRALIRDPNHPAWPEGAGDRLVFHLETLMQVANAAHFAHTRGIIHRDIKPENVMIGSCGEVYLLDWGLAYCPHTDDLCDTRVVGTPGYMAPEMLLGDGPQITPRTDVYLLGATLHEVLTGQLRHTGSTLNNVLYAVATSAPVRFPASVPAELAALCNQATAADPAQRPASALAFRTALADFLRHRGSRAIADAAAARLGELRRLCGNVPGDEREARAVYQRITTLFCEARFGFQEAIRACEHNVAARAALDETLVCMTRHELARRNPEAAAALLPELSTPRPDLAEQVEVLRADLARERAETLALRNLATEFDPVVSARARRVALLSTAVVVATLMLSLGHLFPDLVTNTAASCLAGGITLALATMLILGRRRLLANCFSWTLWFGAVAMTLGITANHAIANFTGTPFVAAVPYNLIVQAVTTSALITFMHWRMCVAPLIYLTGAVVTVARPDWCATILPLTNFFGISAVALLGGGESYWQIAHGVPALAERPSDAGPSGAQAWPSP